MPTKRLLTWVIVLMALVMVPTDDSLCQGTPPAADSQLTSVDWLERAKAFETIRKNPGGWTTPGRRAALLALFRREDDLTISSLRASGGKVAVGDRYGEGYAEYTAQVFDVCFRYCDRTAFMGILRRDAAAGSPIRSSTLDVLNVLYDRGELSGEERAAALGDFLNAVNDSTSWMIRESALGALGVAIRSPSGMSNQERTEVHRALLSGIEDPFTQVRVGAVLLIGELGNLADTVVLHRIAAEDTTRAMSHGQWHYPVREAAQKALHAIAAHPKN